MLKIGSYNELVVERAVDFGLYLNPKQEEVLLPAKYIPPSTRIGDTLKVFVYTDSEDRPVATTLKPNAVVGDFACLTVKDTTDFGAFMDWGLEKDLLVPRNEQPFKMKRGEKHVVKVCLDETTRRVYATGRIEAACDKPDQDLAVGQKVELLVYRFSRIGIMAVIDNRYTGMLYSNETYGNLAVGQKRTGYIGRIRDDGRIDLSLKKPGYISVTDSTQSVLAVLEKAGGFIACHDKSTPEEVKKTFAMSKKEFKKAIGGLYKTGAIEILENGIRLKKQ